MNKIVVVIPLYNERPQLYKLIESIKNFNTTNKIEKVSFILTDDRSSDDSFDILRNLTKDDKNIIIIQNNKDKGYGSNTRNGIDYSIKLGFNWVIIMDSDLSNPLSDLFVILEKINTRKDIEYLKGNRFAETDSGFIKVPLLRKSLSLIGNIISRILLKNIVRDPTNGFRAIKLSRWMEIRTYEDSFPVIVEELKLAIEKNLKIDQFNTKLRYDQVLRRKSSFNFNFQTIYSYLNYLFKARKYVK